jgi:hypothetical protein
MLDAAFERTSLADMFANVAWNQDAILYSGAFQNNARSFLSPQS